MNNLCKIRSASTHHATTHSVRKHNQIRGSSLHHVVIYAGHKKHPWFGPYLANIPKRVAMFEYLNKYRKKPWSVEVVDGDDLIDHLKMKPLEETLLVIPAGQSTRLDKVFSAAQTAFLKNEFFMKGGRGYFNCGSAYWVSEKRIYRDLCEEAPETKQPLIKTTNLPLFYGEAEGPLCPYPGKKYRVGFFSDAVEVTDGKEKCTIYLSGGGSFRIPEKIANGEQVSVLIKYLPTELKRHGKAESEIPLWENAAIMTSVGKGAALLSMFHPYYGPNDIDPETYSRAFPDSGTDWNRVKASLTPLEARMQFVYHSMLMPLERLEF